MCDVHYCGADSSAAHGALLDVYILCTSSHYMSPTAGSNLIQVKFCECGTVSYDAIFHLTDGKCNIVDIWAFISRLARPKTNGHSRSQHYHSICRKFERINHHHLLSLSRDEQRKLSGIINDFV